MKSITTRGALFACVAFAALLIRAPASTTTHSPPGSLAVVSPKVDAHRGEIAKAALELNCREAFALQYSELSVSAETESAPSPASVPPFRVNGFWTLRAIGSDLLMRPGWGCSC